MDLTPVASSGATLTSWVDQIVTLPDFPAGDEFEIVVFNAAGGFSSGDILITDLLFTYNNLSDLQDTAAARSNLNVYSTTDVDAAISSVMSEVNLRIIRPSGTVEGNIPVFNMDGNLDDGGVALSAMATASSVADAIANLVNSSPAALDTLNELATALGNDPAFATTVTNSLGLKAPLASPALTGTPTAPTAAGGTNTTQLATTAFVTAAAAAKQPLDATLTALAGVTTAVDKLIYATGADTFSTADFTAAARTLVALNATAGNVLYASATNTWAQATPDVAGLVDKASAQTGIAGAKTWTGAQTFARPITVYDPTASTGVSKLSLRAGAGDSGVTNVVEVLANNGSTMWFTIAGNGSSSILTLTGINGLWGLSNAGNGLKLHSSADIQFSSGSVAVATAADVILGRVSANIQFLRGASAAGVSSSLEFQGLSATSVVKTVGSIVSSFIVATDASYTGRVVLNVKDAAATRPVITMDATGSAAAIGFLGSAASVRTAITGSRGGNAALAALLTELAAKGLITDSTTA